MSIYRFALAAVSLALAAVLQMTTAFSIAIGPAHPDIVLTSIVCVALLVDLPGGAAAGLWGGLLMATVVGVNYGSFLFSRSIAGVFSGWLGEQPLRDDAFAPPIVTVFATLLCEGVYFLMAPSHHGRLWLTRVAFEAVYNAALSIPIWLLLRKAELKRNTDSAFGVR